MTAPSLGPDGPAATRDLLRALDLAAALEAQQAGHRERFEPLLLAVVDALDALDRLSGGMSTVDDARNSLRGVARVLESALHQAGAKVTGRVGDPVDPGTDRVIEVRQVAGADAETIVAVVRRGCVYGDRVLRTAQVAIGTTTDVNNSEVADEIDRD